jgi:heavy metal translocating P-type ATPase
MTSSKVQKISIFDFFIVFACIFCAIIHFLIPKSLGSFFSFSIDNLPLLFVIAVGGVPISAKIIIKLFKKDFGADLLALIAMVVAVYLQDYLTATLIVFMLSSGQALEKYAVKKASNVLFALAQRLPNKVHLKKENQAIEIDLDAIKIDDEILIYPHETCPVDGVIVEGNSKMDESYLTGEPYSVEKTVGSNVLSGSVNGNGLITIKVLKLPKDSRYSQIVKVITDAEEKKPQIRRMADNIGAVFTPIALVFSLLTWYLTADITRFLAVLVVATPCPLLIAIPITIISAISMATKRGIIIKDPAILEKLPICRTAIFDKTGTLTYGRPDLVEISLAEGENEKEVLQLVASIERYSKHPLANAIIKKAESLNLSFLPAQRINEKPGEGLVGEINNNEFFITSRKYFVSKFSEALLPKVKGGLECVILKNGKYLATFLFRDGLRSDGKSFISHLSPAHKFNKIMIVSGDKQQEVDYLAGLLDITETYASQSPEQKLQIVLRENKLAPTLFMGDGINDAPALTASTVGIAFGNLTKVTAESAGAVVMENTLTKVDELIHIAIDTRKIALQSAIGGMALSLIAMVFAAFGYIPPVYGALIQEGIDVLAILNALRLTFSNNIKTDIA